jgi:hypothetical protein
VLDPQNRPIARLQLLSENGKRLEPGDIVVSPGRKGSRRATPPMLMSTGPVEAEGKIIHVGARLATAEARVSDSTGKLYAHGSTTCMIFPVAEGQRSK